MDEIGIPSYRDSFFCNYRMYRASFFKLNELIKGHRIFYSCMECAWIQAPSEVQLFVLLKCLDMIGTDTSNRAVSTFFMIGSGTAEFFRCRALIAVISFESQALRQPDEMERVPIAYEIQNSSSFPNYVGVFDGILLPLEFRAFNHGETYFTSKGYYEVNMLIVCDLRERITYYAARWQNSGHDNSVLRNCDLCFAPRNSPWARSICWLIVHFPQANMSFLLSNHVRTRSYAATTENSIICSPCHESSPNIAEYLSKEDFPGSKIHAFDFVIVNLWRWSATAWKLALYSIICCSTPSIRRNGLKKMSEK